MVDVQIGAPSPPSSDGGEVRAGVIEEALRRQRRHRRVGAALIGTAALAAGVLAGFGGGSGGGPGPGRVAGGGPNGPVPVAWRHAGSRAFLMVAGHDHACAWPAKARRGPVRVLDQVPPKALTSVLAVLSKPASSGSRVSPAVLRASLRQFPLYAQGIYIRYARRGYAAGLAYYLIPAAHLGIGRVPARCYLQEAAAFKAQIAHLPAASRQSALSWERQQISIDQAGGPPGVELVTKGSGVGGYGRNYTVDELRADPYNGGGGGGSGNDTVTETALLVPNNVGSVTARYSPQKAPGRVAHPVAVTRPAVNNLVIFVYRGAWDPPALTYRSSSGTPLSTAPRQ